mmetsp:Transcript_19710/g.40422  ORF Transcript_19710/g.40422 Transcript_19710/m.40422 type:complete len:217 (-) Transcript_19710:472-1122(-)
MLRHTRHHPDPLLDHLVNHLMRQIRQHPRLPLPSIKRHHKPPILPETRHRTRIRNGVIEHRRQRIHDGGKTRGFPTGIPIAVLPPHFGKGMRMRNEIRAPRLSHEHPIRLTQQFLGPSIELLGIQRYPRPRLDGVRNVHDDDVEGLFRLHEVFVSVSDDELEFGVVEDGLAAPFGEEALADVDDLGVDVDHDEAGDGGVAEDFAGRGEFASSADED